MVSHARGHVSVVVLNPGSGPALIQANGGNDFGEGGGGGGGRIALYYDSLDPSVTVQAKGGAGNERGGAGTM